MTESPAATCLWKTVNDYPMHGRLSKATLVVKQNLRGKSNKSPGSTVYGTKLDHQCRFIPNKMEGGHAQHGVYVRVTWDARVRSSNRDLVVMALPTTISRHYTGSNQ